MEFQQGLADERDAESSHTLSEQLDAKPMLHYRRKGVYLGSCLILGKRSFGEVIEIWNAKRPFTDGACASFVAVYSDPQLGFKNEHAVEA